MCLNALTRIYPLSYIRIVGSLFEVIAEPNRRAILSLLVTSEQSVGNIESRLGMSQPTVSKHLRVLRDAGIVEASRLAAYKLPRDSAALAALDKALAGHSFQAESLPAPKKP